MRWLLVTIYKPPKQDLGYFLSHLSNLIDFYNFERCILIGDFNADPTNPKLLPFMDSQMLHNHVNFKICFKSNDGSCIDLILSNKQHSLHSTGSFNTGVGDYHHLIYTMLKSTYTKLQPKRIIYRCYENLEKRNFENNLTEEFYRKSIDLGDYDKFEAIFESILDKHAPKKSKLIRGNEKSHITKELKRAIMKRSKLWNKYHKTK